jgi:hypothetical protein
MYTGQVGITRTYVEMAWRLCVTEGRISPWDGCSRIECINGNDVSLPWSKEERQRAP